MIKRNKNPDIEAAANGTEKQPRPGKARSKAALRHGTYATVITVLFIAGVILLNILATALADRFPLTIDLTADKTHTLSEENQEFIKSVTRDVTITVCAAETDYASSAGFLSDYARSAYNAVDSTGKYYAQTVSLLKDYPKYNSKIKLEFADPQKPEFADVQQRFANTQIAYGDILVESSFTLDGKPVSRNKVITFKDTYTLEDPTGYAAMGYSSYSISGSNVETAVTSAVNTVTSDKATAVGMISSHSSTDAVSTLKTNMESNNYEFSDITDLIGGTISSDLDMVLIAAPSSDFAASELAKLEAFLENDGKRGKALVFFADAASPDLPNLYDFLAEWGIRYESGILYGTDSNNYINTPTTLIASNSATDFTASVNNANVLYVSGSNVPMSITFDTQGNRATKEILATADTVVIRPVGAGSTWEPGSADQKASYPLAVVSTDTVYDSSNNQVKSYVAAFSSVDFISLTWTQYSMVGNMDFTLAAMNSISGRDASAKTFTAKTITSTSYTDQVTGMKVNVIRIIFVAVLPVALIVTGIIIWFRRKNR